jgi:serine protease Do
MAVGNPFGIGQTVTMGIVSALGRGGMGIEDYEDFIQTDASINPGNSGGALVDMEGRLVGINTAILSRSGGNQGVGFAVPVNLVRHVMDELVKSGKVSRGYLGVMIQDVTPELAKTFNLKETTGALIGEVTEDSAAAEAGLKPGDVITEFNGKKIRDGRSLRNNAGLLSPGTKTDVKVLRDGKERTFKVALRELPGEKATASNGSAGEGAEEVLAGVGVGDLTPELRQQLKLPPHVKGAIITDIAPNSAAYDAGLREGDVIQEINRRPIASAEEAVKATSNVKERRTLVRAWGNGGSRFIVVDETKQK